MEIEELIVEATKGNKTALEGVVAAIQEDIYYLALRMLANPENAKDATQEILIKAITNLSSFRFESQFKTWVFRIAANHLVSAKKILKKDPGLTFDLYKQDLECDLQEPSYLQDDPEYPILLNELCISCTMAMLLCLNPAHRITYIFGDIFEMGHVEASKILSISKENIRKQLSRARSKIIEFTSNSCVFVNSHAKCSCENKLTGAIMRKRVSRDSICFASDAQYSYNEVQESLQVTQQDLKTLALQTSINHYKCPIKLSAIIESLVAEGIKANKTLHPKSQ